MHLNIVKGDFLYNSWAENGYDDYSRKVHELRQQGYRKINQEFDYQDYYEYYRKKGKKEIITVTILGC